MITFLFLNESLNEQIEHLYLQVKSPTNVHNVTSDAVMRHTFQSTC